MYDADEVLRQVFNFSAFGKLAGNSWAQASVAFGMHGYADVMNGLEQMRLSTKRKETFFPKIITMWNTTRFVISFLFALTLLRGMIEYHGLDFKTYPKGGLLFFLVLCVDAILIRPLAIYCQRSHDDLYPPKPRAELLEWEEYTFTQKCCRFVFYYEGILSGCSGAVYFMFPQLFLWLFGMQTDSDAIAQWGLSNFGILVTTFGLYQMNSDLDTRWGHVLWWLILDVVWMWVYVQGVTDRLGYFNPLLFQGGNFWCQSAFHADSTLALARAVFLFTLLFKKKPSSVSGTGKKSS